MVRTSTIIVAALAIAPALAAPLADDVAEDFTLRSVDETLDLEARKFKLGKAFKKFKGLAKTAIKVANPAAGLVLRGIEDGEGLEARTLRPSGVHVHHGGHSSPPHTPHTPHHPHHPHPRPHPHHPHPHPHPRSIDNVDEPLSARAISKPHRLGPKVGQRKKVGGRRVPGHKGRGKGKGKGKKGRGKGKKHHGKGKKGHGKGRRGTKGYAGKKHSRHPRSVEDLEDEVIARDFDEELESRDLDFDTAIAEIVERAVFDASEVLELRDAEDLDARGEFGDADVEDLIARDEPVSFDELD